MRSLSVIKYGIIRKCKTMPFTKMYSNSYKYENFEEMSKQDLIKRLQQLENKIQQLKTEIDETSKTKENCNELIEINNVTTSFDFSKFKKRHIFLKLLYLGWDYHGMASQHDNIKTIENELFKALKRINLIESIETANYQRCGRTDKGVSALSQVISIDLRTNLIEGKGVFTPNNYKSNNRKEKEISYCQVINEVLPENIRIVAWAPIDPNIDARFNCKSRIYKYYFIKANLDIKKMQEAAKYFIGEHDFRNFCKMDMKNIVTNYCRKVIDISICPASTCLNEEKFWIYELTIKGYAFLWHQIRYMVTVLFLIGRGKETAEIIKELLNVEKNPKKPHFHMASDLPLVLYEAEYENIEWIHDFEIVQSIIKQLQHVWTCNIIKSKIIQNMIDGLENEYKILPFERENFLNGNIENSFKHKPLLERKFGETLEERVNIAMMKKKRYLIWKNYHL